MKQEDNNLLVEDILGRLPYNLIVNVCGTEGYDRKLLSLEKRRTQNEFLAVIACEDEDYVPMTMRMSNIKPYLRSMLRMTEEERTEYNGFFHEKPRDFITPSIAVKMFKWLNMHHFDYRGLIEKGLAIEAPKDMYSI